MSMVKWYTLRVKGGREEKIKKNIENAILSENLTNYFNEIKAPYERIYVKNKGKKKIKKKYLSYLFIAIDLESSSNIKELINSVEDVYGFVGLSGWGSKQDPVPVSTKEIDIMLGKVQEMDNAEDFIENSFVEGQKIKIISGPFENSIGTIKKVAKSQKKLIVVIKLFKQDLSELELSYTEVKKIN